MKENNITFTEGNEFTFTDEQGRPVLWVSFDMDPGGALITIQAYDTDGHPTAHFGIDYLGAGYPQCVTADKQPPMVEKVMMVEKVIRSGEIE